MKTTNCKTNPPSSALSPEPPTLRSRSTSHRWKAFSLSFITTQLGKIYLICQHAR